MTETEVVTHTTVVETRTVETREGEYIGPDTGRGMVDAEGNPVVHEGLPEGEAGAVDLEKQNEEVEVEDVKLEEAEAEAEAEAEEEEEAPEEEEEEDAGDDY